MDKVDEEAEEQDDEEEPSNSLPSSPKLSLRLPLTHTHSHSFDDLLSSVNNEVVTSPTSMASPKSPFRQISPTPVQFHPLESGESGSDSEIEMSEFSSLGRKRVYATNPLSDHSPGGGNSDRNQSETDTDRSGDERTRKASDSSGGTGAGKFAQLRGKFFQRVSNLRPPKTSLRQKTRTHQNGVESDSSVPPQSSSKFTSMRRGLNSSTEALKKLRNRSPPKSEPSDEELKRQKAMEKSKTNFLIL